MLTAEDKVAILESLPKLYRIDASTVTKEFNSQSKREPIDCSVISEYLVYLEEIDLIRKLGPMFGEFIIYRLG